MEGLFTFCYHPRPPNTHCRIHETTAQLQTPNGAGKNPSSVKPVQLEVKFVYSKHYKITMRSPSDSNTEITVMESGKIVKERSCPFDMDKLKNYGDGHAFGILSGFLGTIGLFHGAKEQKRDWARQTMEAGLQIGNMVSNMGRKVLGLRVDVITEYVYLYCDFHTQIERNRMLADAINRSMADATAGMVPASDAWIAKGLKRVRVGGDDDEEEEAPAKMRGKISESESCTVCLDELKGGSKVASMPCEHLFHEDCIVTWLKQSHYCPVCRFEVPVD